MVLCHPAQENTQDKGTLEPFLHTQINSWILSVHRNE